MVPSTYEYSFEAVKLRSVPNGRIDWVRQFTADAQIVLDTLLKYNPPQIPLMAPLPDRNINMGFSGPLTPSLLQQLAGKGYRCRDLPESEYVSDKAAE